ncbi:MAG: phage tail tape measure protein [Rhizobiaceae bacterium]
MATLRSDLILSLIDKVTAPARGIAASLGRINGAVGRFNRGNLAAFGMGGFAGRLLAMGAGYVGVTQGMRGTVGAALSFESAMADVRKVLDVNDEQFGNITNRIRAMSRELPIGAEGIAAIYAAAGQSNIPTAEIEKFTKIVAESSVAWDIGQSETGDALAKIKAQLNLSVGDLGLFADALNHLSNQSAANAPALVDYAKRVAGTGEMYGFSATQTLAFGSAMVSVGAESEVAATSFRNMGRALTIGSRATLMQRTAFKRLGIDSVKTAKSMQKNALSTTLDVIDKIQKLPEWERVSIASALFGDEARALMPLINNSTELRRQLDMIADSAQYAGSAHEEYVKRAATVGNVLEITKNKIADVFRGVGMDFLPWLKEASLGLGDVLDTLGSRAGVFDKLGAGMRGFVQGLGFDGGIREAVNALGDLLFGVNDGSGAADRLGEIFMKMKGWGEAVRSLSDAIKGSGIGSFLATIGSYGFSFAAAAIGIGLLAGAIGKLAKALYLLSGAKFAVGLLKQLGKLTKWATAAEVVADAAGDVGGKKGAGKAAGAKTLGAKTPVTKLPAVRKLPLGLGINFPTILGAAAAELTRRVIEQTSAAVQAQNRQDGGRAVISGQGDQADIANRYRQNFGQYYEAGGWHRVVSQGGPMPTAADQNNGWRSRNFGDNMPTNPDLAAELRSLTMRTQPVGVSEVHMTNPPPPVHAPISVVVHVQQAAEAGPAVGKAVGDAVGRAAQAAVEGGYHDGGV